jgi:hypothetical protein
VEVASVALRVINAEEKSGKRSLPLPLPLLLEIEDLLCMLNIPGFGRDGEYCKKSSRGATRT